MSLKESPEILIDGNLGEGGGQILRTSLSLSLCLGIPFRIEHIRSSRNRPGLQAQHLAAVHAARTISQAHVEGDEKDSQELFFSPGEVQPGEYNFSVGTAGSTSLVLQTILPALMQADSPSCLMLEGGTHNPLAPPYDFVQTCFIPIVNHMGPKITALLLQPGFAPKGGGKIKVEIIPVSTLHPIDILERGEVQSQYAEVLLAHLPEHIAQREFNVLQQHLGYSDDQLILRMANLAYGPGNVVSAYIRSENITECFSSFGQPGLPAEVVAENVVIQVQRYLKAGVPVGPMLADQLLVPMALAGSGRFMTVQPSLHTWTNIRIIQAFMQVDIRAVDLGNDVWEIRIGDNARYHDA